jgi:hypothetical protein
MRTTRRDSGAGSTAWLAFVARLRRSAATAASSAENSLNSKASQYFASPVAVRAAVAAAGAAR